MSRYQSAWELRSKLPPKSKVNRGSEQLIPKEEWCPASELYGTDLDVLNHPLMKKAQERVIEEHHVTSSIVYCGTCTATRPYRFSLRWSTVERRIGDLCDLIVVSDGGGVVPYQFQEGFPYLTYNAHGYNPSDSLFMGTLSERLKSFFSIHRYRHILFNFMPHVRNAKVGMIAGVWLRQHGYCESWVVLPTLAQYKLMHYTRKARNFSSGYKMSPEISNELWPYVQRQLDIWRSENE